MLDAWFLVVLAVATLVTFSAWAVTLVGAFFWTDPLTTAEQQALGTANNVLLIGAGSILGLLSGYAA